MKEQYKPEIGEEFEVWSDYQWDKVKCVGYDGEDIVWKNLAANNYSCSPTTKARKCEDPYTAFAIELKLLFDYDLHIYNHLNHNDYAALISLLWSHGYRKEKED